MRMKEEHIVRHARCGHARENKTRSAKPIAERCVKREVRPYDRDGRKEDNITNRAA